MEHINHLQQINQPSVQEQAMDILMNGFYNETTPSILGLQVPNFALSNNSHPSGNQAVGLQSRYNLLLNMIEELKKDIRPCYACSKMSAERLKRNINLARVEIRNCIMELERCSVDGQQSKQ